MIIAICNLKGGVGKTTTAMALATEAADEGFSSVVLDADPQASATLWANYAEEAGTPLPFAVDSANIGTIARKTSFAKGAPDTWAFVDCPPNGDIISAAAKLADMVVIPTGTGSADMLKTVALAEALGSSGVFRAVLVERAAANTIALRETVGELEERRIDYFDTVVPAREEIRNTYGNPLGANRHGFDGVFREVKSALCGEE
ncbi:MAG: AAA family ATPase [Coriobacteriales bacterium]